MTTPDPTRSKAIEVMARERSSHLNEDWDMLSCYEQTVELEAAAAALTAYESHLQAEGMAVVPGWRDIETADLELCSRAPCLVSADGAVGEARYFPNEKGWWWADFHPTDYLDRRCFPTHWMPLPSPYGKASMQEGTAEAQSAVANSPSMKAGKEESNG